MGGSALFPSLSDVQSKTVNRQSEGENPRPEEQLKWETAFSEWKRNRTVEG